MSDFQLSQELILAAGYQTQVEARHAFERTELESYNGDMGDEVRTIALVTYDRLRTIVRQRHAGILGRAAMWRSRPNLEIISETHSTIGVRTAMFGEDPDIFSNRLQTVGWELQATIPTKSSEKEMMRVSQMFKNGKPIAHHGQQQNTITINRVARDDALVRREAFYLVRPDFESGYIVASQPAAGDTRHEANIKVALGLYDAQQHAKEQEKLAFATAHGIDTESCTFKNLLVSSHCYRPFPLLDPHDYFTLTNDMRRDKIRVRVPSASPEAIEHCLFLLKLGAEAIGTKRS
jgi:hypothetical protein